MCTTALSLTQTASSTALGLTKQRHPPHLVLRKHNPLESRS